MSKKLIVLTSFVLVLSIAGNASADLVAHWNLEEGSGATTTAAIGSPDADGTLVGATWVTADVAPISGSTLRLFFLNRRVATGLRLTMWVFWAKRSVP